MHKRISILLPLSGVLGVERLVSLYGLPLADPNLQIMVLFGLLGASLVGCALRTSAPAAISVRGAHPAFWMIYQRLRRKST